MLFSKKVLFDNFYSKQEEEIILSYDFKDGFDTTENACKEVVKQGQNPSCFNFILFNNQYYAVSIETNAKEIVIAKDCSWYYHKGSFQLFSNKEDFKAPYIIEKSRSSHFWMKTIYDDLEKFNKKPLEIIFGGSRSKSFAFNSTILLGIVMFSTLVPVFQLNALDKYFLDYAPSRGKLWKQGIKEINPFSNETVKQSKPYLYEEYKKEVPKAVTITDVVFEEDTRARTTRYYGWNVGDYLPEHFVDNVLNK